MEKECLRKEVDKEMDKKEELLTKHGETVDDDTLEVAKKW